MVCVHDTIISRKQAEIPIKTIKFQVFACAKWFMSVLKKSRKQPVERASSNIRQGFSFNSYLTIVETLMKTTKFPWRGMVLVYAKWLMSMLK